MSILCVYCVLDILCNICIISFEFYIKYCIVYIIYAVQTLDFLMHSHQLFCESHQFPLLSAIHALQLLVHHQ